MNERLERACFCGDLKIVKHIVDQANEKNYQLNWINCSHIAAENGYLHILEWMKTQNKPIYYVHALERAITSGHIESIKWILKHYKFSLQNGYYYLIDIFDHTKPQLSFQTLTQSEWLLVQQLIYNISPLLPGDCRVKSDFPGFFASKRKQKLIYLFFYYRFKIKKHYIPLKPIPNDKQLFIIEILINYNTKTEWLKNGTYDKELLRVCKYRHQARKQLILLLRRFFPQHILHMVIKPFISVSNDV